MRRFSESERNEIIQKRIYEHRTIRSLSEEYKVSFYRICTWVKQYYEEHPGEDVHCSRMEMQKKLERLTRESEALRKENEMLKTIVGNMEDLPWENQHRKQLQLIRDLMNTAHEQQCVIFYQAPVRVNACLCQLGGMDFDPAKYKLFFPVSCDNGEIQRLHVEFHIGSDRCKQILIEELTKRVGDDHLLMENGPQHTEIFVFEGEQDVARVMDYLNAEEHLEPDEVQSAIYDCIMMTKKEFFTMDVVVDPIAERLEQFWKQTGINPSDSQKVKTHEEKVMALFSQEQLFGMKEELRLLFGNEELVKGFLQICTAKRPGNEEEVLTAYSLAVGSYRRADYLEMILEHEEELRNLVTCREDIYRYLVRHGIEKDMSFRISEFIRKGLVKNQLLSKRWKNYSKLMSQHGIHRFFLEWCEQVEYLPSKVNNAVVVENWMRLLWFLTHQKNNK